MSSPDITAGFREDISRIIQPENIIDDSSILNEYSRDSSLVKGSRPWLVVYPENKEQVKGLVRLANQYRMPLIPVSSRAPHFYGNTVPAQSGVIVNFQKMNHILKIDATSRYAMIEPGVTFGELIPEVRAQGMKLNIPLLPQASKSVLTAYLEREPVLIPKYQYDYIDPLLTLEIVYGTGDEMRTGSASGPGDLEHLKSDKVNPWGPGSIDYSRFVSGAQGTMGLVTWATVKTEVLPSIQKLYFFSANDAGKLTVLASDFLRKRVVDECLILNNANLAALLSENQMTSYIVLKESLPPWTLIVCIAGYQRHPAERVAIHQKQLFNICEEYGLKPQINLPEAGGRKTVTPDLLSNVWSGGSSWKLQIKKSCHDIFFLTPLSRVEKYIELMQSIAAKRNHPFDDIGCYIQPMVQGRGCHCEFDLFYDGSNTAVTSRVKSLFQEASGILKSHGVFFSRPYGSWANLVYRQDSEEVSALRKLKNIFDPNHILNPGKLCF
jgi:FAD/FMN-containing dehydrogenase